MGLYRAIKDVFGEIKKLFSRLKGLVKNIIIVVTTRLVVVSLYLITPIELFSIFGDSAFYPLSGDFPELVIFYDYVLSPISFFYMEHIYFFSVLIAFFHIAAITGSFPLRIPFPIRLTRYVRTALAQGILLSTMVAFEGILFQGLFSPSDQSTYYVCEIIAQAAMVYFLPLTAWSVFWSLFGIIPVIPIATEGARKTLQYYKGLQY